MKGDIITKVHGEPKIAQYGWVIDWTQENVT